MLGGKKIPNEIGEGVLNVSYAVTCSFDLSTRDSRYGMSKKLHGLAVVSIWMNRDFAKALKSHCLAGQK